jgi:hypothetical protein
LPLRFNSVMLVFTCANKCMHNSDVILGCQRESSDSESCLDHIIISKIGGRFVQSEKQSNRAHDRGNVRFHLDLPPCVFLRHIKE